MENSDCRTGVAISTHLYHLDERKLSLTSLVRKSIEKKIFCCLPPTIFHLSFENY